MDPLDFHRALDGVDPEECLVVILSKSFTTAETLLNTRTVKKWLVGHYQSSHPEVSEEKIISSHFCAVSSNIKLTSEFGISPERVFGFWDWVGGRFSVSSAIGILELSIVFGYSISEQFLSGMNDIDQNFKTESDWQKNIPVFLGLVGFYQSTIQEFESRAILPYSQALCRFAAHIQQVDMESNGKSVTLSGEDLVGYRAGVINFGEPGTNSQHSFFQLLHQGKKKNNF